jgi:anti-sigma factor ChrR (cupin superfamily)
MTRRRATQTADAAEHALATLGLAAPPMAPPTGLWARIEAAIAPLVAVERFAEGRWRDLAPGVRYKRLWSSRTLLLQCQPDAFVPEHEHASYEHAVVLSGDLVSDQGTFHAGDYHGLPQGMIHKPWTSRTGCLVLIQYAA